MATFNTYVKLGALRGNSLLSFNLSGCTTNNKNSCTALTNYQDVLHTQFGGAGLYVTGLTLHSTYYIYIEPSRKVLGSNCDSSIPREEMVAITGIPTPTPTTTPTPVPTSTPTNTPTPSPTPIVCSFDANVVYGLSGTATPTNVPTATPTGVPPTTPPTLPPTTPPTLPPTTPPTLPPTTPPTLPPTATPIPCVTSASFEVISGGQIRYVDCCGVTEYMNVGAGPEVINGCIENGSVYALSATIETVTYGTTPCTCPATPTPLPPTPTATPIPYQLTVFTGNSLSTACSNLVNPLLEPTILFYQGSLGVGTVVYRNNNYTNPVVGIVYCAADSSTVYVVNGFEPPTDGYITSITSCPAATLEPTPIPQPTTYDIYTVCADLVTRYYVDYYTSNFNFAIVNGVCCSKDVTNVTLDYINTNYPSATYQTINNTQCVCN
jgi:hypothetical protein